MTPDRIVIAPGPGETRAALMAGETLIEVAHVRAAEAQPGAVYVGRVGERLPGAPDVFVDIGVGPAGVLEVKGAAPRAGQWLAVEVLSPARADKGHKLARAAVPLPAGIDAPRLLAPAPDPVAEWRDIYKDIPVAEAAAADVADLDEQIEAALEPVVTLPGGGRVIIETTAALAAIDIDAGRGGAAQANTEAMTAVARHIRLRNLAGHIVVDLIPQKGRGRFLAALKAACADDPVETRVLGFTPSGLIDILRRRRRPSLAETLINDDTVAYRALRLACRELHARRAARVTLAVPRAVAALLAGRLAGALAAARDMAKGEIAVTARADFTPARIEVS